MSNQNVNKPITIIHYFCIVVTYLLNSDYYYSVFCEVNIVFTVVCAHQQYIYDLHITFKALKSNKTDTITSTALYILSLLKILVFACKLKN